MSKRKSHPDRLHLLNRRRGVASSFMKVDSRSGTAFGTSVLLLASIIGRSHAGSGATLLLGLSGHHSPLISFVVGAASVKHGDSGPTCTRTYVDLCGVLGPCHNVRGVPVRRRATRVGNVLCSLSGPRGGRGVALLRLSSAISRLHGMGSRFSTLSDSEAGRQTVGTIKATGRVHRHLGSRCSCVAAAVFTRDVTIPSSRTALFVARLGRLVSRAHATCGLHGNVATSGGGGKRNNGSRHPNRLWTLSSLLRRVARADAGQRNLRRWPVSVHTCFRPFRAPPGSCFVVEVVGVLVSGVFW